MTLPDWFPRKVLYRPGEVADFVGVDVRTIQRDMDAGAFGFEGVRKRGSQRRITYDGFLHYLEEAFPPENSPA